MDQIIWGAVFVGIAFGVYIGITVWSRAGSTREYYRQRRRIPLCQWDSTAADWMSAATFISMSQGIGICRPQNYDGMDRRLCFAHHPDGSLPQGNSARVPCPTLWRPIPSMVPAVALICAIFICMTYIMGQMRGVGIVFSRLFDIEIWMGVLIGGGIVFFYAGLGGMKELLTLRSLSIV